MSQYRDYTVLSEATEAFEALRESEKRGEVQWVNLSERSDTYLRIFPDMKRYLVSWHEWVD